MSRFTRTYMRPVYWIDRHVESNYWAQVIASLYFLWPLLLFFFGLMAWGLMHR